MGKLVLIDPYQNSHIRMIEQLENENNEKKEISAYLKHISSSFTNEEYQNHKKHDNSIEEYLVIKESEQIKDICQITGEKDRKICQLVFPFSTKNPKRKNLILQATDFAMNQLGIMEVLISINPDSKELASFLEKKEYENLGFQDGKIVFLKENVKESDKGYYHESSRKV